MPILSWNFWFCFLNWALQKSWFVSWHFHCIYCIGVTHIQCVELLNYLQNHLLVTCCTWDLITDSQINGKLNSSPDNLQMSLALKKNQFIFLEKVCYVLVFSGTSGMIHSEQRRETLKLLSDFYYVKDSKVLPDSNICPCKHFPNLKFFVLASPELGFFFL